jgi:hypothetical protein
VLGPSWLATRGLPEPRTFVAMLTGDWSGADWASPRVLSNDWSSVRAEGAR